MREVCDLCRSSNLETVYQPAESATGASVHLCSDCGLVQSLPRGRSPRRETTPASSATARYGKALRSEPCLAMIRALTDFRRPLSVLDVGSERGAFAQAFLKEANAAQLTCVEPDARVAGSCAAFERAEVMQMRIEETRFPDEAFDIIHSCHTIEHLASPAATLADHWRTLKPGGLLVLDASNLAFAGSEDILEECFTDSRLHHFSRGTLLRLLDASGFEIIGGPDPLDSENLLVAARKRNVSTRPVRPDRDEVERALMLVTTYVKNRAANLAAMTSVAAELAALSSKRVAVWGAGHLFDALIEQGKFNPKTLALLVDTHLAGHVNERHGVKVAGPDALAAAKPGVIVVMSRAFAGEIAEIAAMRVPKAKIVLYSDLIARARMKRAA